MATPYQELVIADGSASNKTIFGSRIPQGKVVCITELCAVVYTTVVGDYNSATYICIGSEIQDKKHYHMGRDIKDVQLVIRSQNCVWLKEGDRPFADFEATADTTTYNLVVNGVMFDVEEMKKGLPISPVPAKA